MGILEMTSISQEEIENTTSTPSNLAEKTRKTLTQPAEQIKKAVQAGELNFTASEQAIMDAAPDPSPPETDSTGGVDLAQIAGTGADLGKLTNPIGWGMLATETAAGDDTGIQNPDVQDALVGEGAGETIRKTGEQVNKAVQDAAEKIKVQPQIGPDFDLSKAVGYLGAATAAVILGKEALKRL